MGDTPKEPIDLLQWRNEKLFEKRKHEERDRETQKQLDWPGSRFQKEAESIELPEELLHRVKVMMCAIVAGVKDAESIHDVKHSCFGLALLLLKDYDRQAYEKLLALIRQEWQET